MQEAFTYSDRGKRYHTYDYYLRHRYGCKVCRIPLSGGFSCPNRDGTKGVGGCDFCSGAGSGEFAGDAALPIAQQARQVRAGTVKKWPQAKYIPYFQAFTGTFAPLWRLRELYEAALKLPDTVGLSIATRPDAIAPGVMDYLGELARRTDLSVELGVQTCHDRTAAALNCQHTWEEFLECFWRLRERGIAVCVHLIDGLPGEDRGMMAESARKVGELRVDALKLHLLYAVRGTVIGERYERGELRLLTREEYVDIICDQLELLPPQTVIQRLTGDGAPGELLGPQWSRKKLCVLNEIDKELRRRDSVQGCRYQAKY